MVKKLAEIGREKKVEAGKLYGEAHPKEEVLSINDKTSDSDEAWPDQPAPATKHNTQKEIATAAGMSTGRHAQAAQSVI